MRNRIKKTYRFLRSFNDGLADLYLAWEEYFIDKFNNLRVDRRLFIALLYFFAIGLGVIVLRLVETNVYAQGEEVIYSTSFIFPLQKLFAWVFRGGLFGLLVGMIRRNYYAFKRVFDVCVAYAGLVVLSPLFFIIALLVKIDSHGPIFFKQARVGMNGKLFNIWKFRTMRYNAELETGPVWAQEDDPRTTKIGSFLRKSHLDELPQLFNVIVGDMSLIGPRPERPELVQTISEHVLQFDHRLQIRPGITGLAQVRYSYGASIKDSARKLKFDLLYIKRICWFLDMQIIFWTVGRVLTGEGAR